jgi:hypothetical protein
MAKSETPKILELLFREIRHTHTIIDPCHIATFDQSPNGIIDIYAKWCAQFRSNEMITPILNKSASIQPKKTRQVCEKVQFRCTKCSHIVLYTIRDVKCIECCFRTERHNASS